MIDLNADDLLSLKNLTLSYLFSDSMWIQGPASPVYSCYKFIKVYVIAYMHMYTKKYQGRPSFLGINVHKLLKGDNSTLEGGIKMFRSKQQIFCFFKKFYSRVKMFNVTGVESYCPPIKAYR